MQFHLQIALIILSALFLQSCSPSQKESGTGITPSYNGKFTDPDSALLKVAMQDFLKKNNAPASSTYSFVRFDLNGDKRRDALVMIKTPYGFWCGQHGCVMLVMKAHNNGFTLVNSVQPVRDPVYISRAKTNNWNNIIVRVSGRWKKAKDVALRFDGRQYPKNPGKLKEYPLKPANHPDFIRVLYNDGIRD